MTIARPAPRRDLVEKAAESVIFDFCRQSRENKLYHDMLMPAWVKCVGQLSQVSLGGEVANCQHFLDEPTFPFDRGVGRKMVDKGGFRVARTRFSS